MARSVCGRPCAVAHPHCIAPPYMYGAKIMPHSLLSWVMRSDDPRGCGSQYDQLAQDREPALRPLTTGEGRNAAAVGTWTWMHLRKQTAFFQSHHQIDSGCRYAPIMNIVDGSAKDLGVLMCMPNNCFDFRWRAQPECSIISTLVCPLPHPLQLALVSPLRTGRHSNCASWMVINERSTAHGPAATCSTPGSQEEPASLTKGSPARSAPIGARSRLRAARRARSSP
eukprot:352610-Chlamydomonas_euryale.AAC.6